MRDVFQSQFRVSQGKSCVMKCCSLRVTIIFEKTEGGKRTINCFYAESLQLSAKYGGRCRYFIVVLR